MEDILEEGYGLARAISLRVVGSRITKFQRINPALFIGKGTAEEIALELEELEPSVVIVNHALSPVQQRNLENALKAKVIDRTGLILEIFGERAQTKEGRLQVELAALEYQRSRLVRSWTHLERQRGGAGFMGGPGERQIELDRRQISEKIMRLKIELLDVRRTRDLGRKSRERVPYPVVSLVGYTNAGKSTLFNTLTGAGVFAEDMPFATLDPTMRRLKLPNKQEVILSDTVGFIADLPTHLVAAFRATLEQVVYADVILHVIDVSRSDYRQQRDDVISILGDLDVEYETDKRIIEIYNKTDLLDPESLADLKRHCNFGGGKAVMLSALKRHGTDSLLKMIAEQTARERAMFTYNLKPEDGKALAWLYAHGEVSDKKMSGKSLKVEVYMGAVDRDKFAARFSYQPLGATSKKKA
ncbi:MAG: GTPase HflX [Alphaproteobacteria bacterium]|nr:GTPase HflX [Alphaproteobacteria bacterium]